MSDAPARWPGQGFFDLTVIHLHHRVPLPARSSAYIVGLEDMRKLRLGTSVVLNVPDKPAHADGELPMYQRPDPRIAASLPGVGRGNSLNGSGPPDDQQAAAILAECRKQRARALRWAIISGVLAAALIVATVVAAARGAYHGVAVFLIPVLLLINLMRMAQCLVALGKIRRAERLVRAAQAEAQITTR